MIHNEFIRSRISCCIILYYHRTLMYQYIILTVCWISFAIYLLSLHVFRKKEVLKRLANNTNIDAITVILIVLFALEIWTFFTADNVDTFGWLWFWLLLKIVLTLVLLILWMASKTEQHLLQSLKVVQISSFLSVVFWMVLVASSIPQISALSIASKPQLKTKEEVKKPTTITQLQDEQTATTLQQPTPQSANIITDPQSLQPTPAQSANIITDRSETTNVIPSQGIYDDQQTTIQDLKKSIQKLNQEKHDLQEEIQLLRDHKNELIDKHNELDRNLKETTQKQGELMEQANAELEAKKIQIQTLQQELEKTKKKVKLLEQKYHQLTKEQEIINATAESASNEFRKTISIQKNQLKLEAARLIQLNEKIRALKRTLIKAQKENEELSKQLQTTTNTARNLVQTMPTLLDVQNNADNNQPLSQEKEYNQYHRNAQHALTVKDQQITNQNTQIKKLEKDLQTAKARNKHEKEANEATVKQKDNKIQKLKKQLSMINQAERNAKKALQEVKTDLEKEKKQNLALRMEVAERASMPPQIFRQMRQLQQQQQQTTTTPQQLQKKKRSRKKKSKPRRNSNTATQPSPQHGGNIYPQATSDYAATVAPGVIGPYQPQQQSDYPATVAPGVIGPYQPPGNIYYSSQHGGNIYPQQQGWSNYNNNDMQTW